MRATAETGGRAGRVYATLHDGADDPPEVRRSLRYYAEALIAAWDACAADLRAGRRPPITR